MTDPEQVLYTPKFVSKTLKARFKSEFCFETRGNEQAKNAFTRQGEQAGYKGFVSFGRLNEFSSPSYFL